jgi:intracellular multiplication protein IcmK
MFKQNSYGVTAKLWCTAAVLLAVMVLPNQNAYAQGEMARPDLMEMTAEEQTQIQTADQAQTVTEPQATGEGVAILPRVTNTQEPTTSIDLMNTNEFSNNAPPAARPVNNAPANVIAQTLARATGEEPQNIAQDVAPEDLLGVAAGLPVGPSMAAEPFMMLTPEEAKARAQMEAEEQKQKLRRQAFEGALGSVLPMRPPEIRETLETFKDSREAAETPIVTPRPQIKVETLSLDPSTVPAVVKTTPGHVSTIAILDMTGQPWPIQDVTWAGRFELTPPEEGGHVIRVVPMSAHGIGNMSIRLVDLITPITLSLATGLDETHYRFDATIPEMGPLAKPPLIEKTGLSGIAGDATMVNVLDGVTPTQATVLKVDGVDPRTKAWEIGGKYYIRTPLTMLSPAWQASAQSADGMNVYVMAETPVLLLSERGRMVKAQVRADNIAKTGEENGQ